MRVLVTCYAKADEQSALLLIDTRERAVIATARHPACLRGLTWCGDRLLTADYHGQLLLIDVDDRRVGLRLLSRCDLAIDAHDLTDVGDGTIAVTSSERQLVTIFRHCGKLDHVLRPFFVADGMGDSHHLNCALWDAPRGNWLFSIFHQKAKGSSERWRDMALRDGALVHWGPHGWLLPAYRAGLEMPHSIRRGPGGRIWWANTAAKEIVCDDGRRIALPGLARGLSFGDGAAVVGLSQERHLGSRTGRAAIAVCPLAGDGEPIVIDLPEEFREVYDCLVVE